MAPPHEVFIFVAPTLKCTRHGFDMDHRWFYRCLVRRVDALAGLMRRGEVAIDYHFVVRTLRWPRRAPASPRQLRDCAEGVSPSKLARRAAVMLLQWVVGCVQRRSGRFRGRSLRSNAYTPKTSSSTFGLDRARVEQSHGLVKGRRASAGKLSPQATAAKSGRMSPGPLHGSPDGCSGESFEIGSPSPGRPARTRGKALPFAAQNEPRVHGVVTRSRRAAPAAADAAGGRGDASQAADAPLGA